MTGRIISIGGEGHREIKALLPWFVMGTLRPNEFAAVEAHLAQCPECRAEAEAERVLAAAVRDLSPDPQTDEARGWADMRRRLDREASAVPPPTRMSRWLGGGRRALAGWTAAAGWMRWAVAAQACLVVALAVTLVWQGTRTAEYRALGAAPAAPADTAGNVLVIFQPDIAERDLRALVRASGGRLVDGPTEADAYVLRVPGETRPATLRLLRARPQVVLAEPIDAGGPP